MSSSAIYHSQASLCANTFALRSVSQCAAVAEGSVIRTEELSFLDQTSVPSSEEPDTIWEAHQPSVKVMIFLSICLQRYTMCMSSETCNKMLQYRILLFRVLSRLALYLDTPFQWFPNLFFCTDRLKMAGWLSGPQNDFYACFSSCSALCFFYFLSCIP